MTLSQLIEELKKLEKEHGEEVNVEICIEADAWSFEEDVVAHEISNLEGWEDSNGDKWVEINLK